MNSSFGNGRPPLLQGLGCCPEVENEIRREFFALHHDVAGAGGCHLLPQRQVGTSRSVEAEGSLCYLQVVTVSRFPQICQNKGTLEGVGYIDTLSHLQMKDYTIMQSNQVLVVVGPQRSV